MSPEIKNSCGLLDLTPCMENIVEEVATTKLNLALKSFSISKHNVRITFQTFRKKISLLPKLFRASFLRNIESKRFFWVTLKFYSEWILNENGRKYPTMTDIQSKCCPKGVSFSNGLSLSCDINRADKNLEIPRKCLE